MTPVLGFKMNLQNKTWNNSLQFLLVLASTAILGSESHGTHDHILLSDDSGSFQTISFSILSSNNLLHVVTWVLYSAENMQMNSEHIILPNTNENTRVILGHKYYTSLLAYESI
jgi:hypothetical protein